MPGISCPSLYDYNCEWKEVGLTAGGDGKALWNEGSMTVKYDASVGDWRLFLRKKINKSDTGKNYKLVGIGRMICKRDRIVIEFSNAICVHMKFKPENIRPVVEEILLKIKERHMEVPTSNSQVLSPLAVNKYKSVTPPGNGNHIKPDPFDFDENSEEDVTNAIMDSESHKSPTFTKTKVRGKRSSNCEEDDALTPKKQFQHGGQENRSLSSSSFYGKPSADKFNPEWLNKASGSESSASSAKGHPRTSRTYRDKLPDTRAGQILQNSMEGITGTSSNVSQKRKPGFLSLDDDRPANSLSDSAKKARLHDVSNTHRRDNVSTSTPSFGSSLHQRTMDSYVNEGQERSDGFSNLGNTCYMNAILQSLFCIAPFAIDLLNTNVYKQTRIKSDNHRLYALLAQLLTHQRALTKQKLISSSASLSDQNEILLKHIKSSISRSAENFVGCNQNDAHEFLIAVLDQIKEEIIRVNATSSDARSKEPNETTRGRAIEGGGGDIINPVMQNFEASILQTVKCMNCSSESKTSFIINNLSLDLSAGGIADRELSLQSFLTDFFQQSEVEYKCSRCGHGRSIKSSTYERLPRVLILHLKRFTYIYATSKNEKVTREVFIPKFVTLRDHCTQETSPPYPLPVLHKTIASAENDKKTSPSGGATHEAGQEKKRFEFKKDATFRSSIAVHNDDAAESDKQQLLSELNMDSAELDTETNLNNLTEEQQLQLALRRSKADAAADSSFRHVTIKPTAIWSSPDFAGHSPNLPTAAANRRSIATTSSDNNTGISKPLCSDGTVSGTLKSSEKDKNVSSTVPASKSQSENKERHTAVNKNVGSNEAVIGDEKDSRRCKGLSDLPETMDAPCTPTKTYEYPFFLQVTPSRDLKCVNNEKELVEFFQIYTGVSSLDVRSLIEAYPPLDITGSRIQPKETNQNQDKQVHKSKNTKLIKKKVGKNEESADSCLNSNSNNANVSESSDGEFEEVDADEESVPLNELGRSYISTSSTDNNHVDMRRPSSGGNPLDLAMAITPCSDNNMSRLESGANPGNQSLRFKAENIENCDPTSVSPQALSKSVECNHSVTSASSAPVYPSPSHEPQTPIALSTRDTSHASKRLFEDDDGDGSIEPGGVQRRRRNRPTLKLDSPSDESLITDRKSISSSKTKARSYTPESLNALEVDAGASSARKSLQFFSTSPMAAENKENLLPSTPIKLDIIDTIDKTDNDLARAIEASLLHHQFDEESQIELARQASLLHYDNNPATDLIVGEDIGDSQDAELSTALQNFEVDQSTELFIRGVKLRQCPCPAVQEPIIKLSAHEIPIRPVAKGDLPYSYQLVSVVSHLGFGTERGHYLSDIYDVETDIWKNCDDKTVRPITEESVRQKRSRTGYIFFYLAKDLIDEINAEKQQRKQNARTPPSTSSNVRQRLLSDTV